MIPQNSLCQVAFSKRYNKREREKKKKKSLFFSSPVCVCVCVTSKVVLLVVLKQHTKRRTKVSSFL